MDMDLGIPILPTRMHVYYLWLEKWMCFYKGKTFPNTQHAVIQIQRRRRQLFRQIGRMKWMEIRNGKD